MAKHWPVRIRTPDSANIALETSKSSVPGGNKSSSKLGDNEMLLQRSKNISTPNSSGLSEKKVHVKNRLVPYASEFSLTEPQQRNEWNFKAQEGVITYRLPDGLPDGVALQNKLEKLMKTDTIYLNDRQFWAKLESRFKKLRKVSLIVS